MRAGVLGMARTMGMSAPTQARSDSRRMPAAMERSTGRSRRRTSAMPVTVARATWGFTARTTTWAPDAAAVLSVPAAIPKRSRTRSHWAGSVSAPRSRPGDTPSAMRPPMRLLPMLPQPMKAMTESMSCSLCSRLLRPRTENPRADAHHGSAFRHRRAQVRRRAHGQSVQLEALRPEPLETLAQGAEGAALGLQVRGRGRHGHEPAQPETRQGGHARGQFRQFLRRDPRLGGLVVDVHLDEDIERRLSLRPGLGEAAGDAEPVHGMDPVETRGHVPGLVRLDAPDEVPAKVRSPGLRHLGERFLQVVLAEVPLPAVGGRPDRVRGVSLADCQQAHGTRCATEFTLRCQDGFRNGGEGLCDVFHAMSVRYTRRTATENGDPGAPGRTSKNGLRAARTLARHFSEFIVKP